jgi:hypothetical protein
LLTQPVEGSYGDVVGRGDAVGGEPGGVQMRADVGEDADQERVLHDRPPGAFVGGHRDDEGAGEFQGGGAGHRGPRRR